jgi:FKBP-type peptidyl-prolyl cis-trans isomerase FkpA
MFKNLFGGASSDEPSFVMPADAACKATVSGLKHEILRAGEGRSPAASDSVTVHYAGWTTDGKLFDSSYKRGSPATFPLGRVISGWTEGLQLMREGGASRFVIPPELAYGSRGAPPTIGPNATLVFQVELLRVG